MKIAGDNIINVGDEWITLHPSLRHAIRLVNRSGGFQTVVRDILDGSLSAAVDVIEPNADLSREYLAECLLQSGLSSIKQQLFLYVMHCAGIDPDDAPANENRKTNGHTPKSQPFGEYLHSLYKIGTGWLGWTPEQTLDSTPFEIMLAHEGRQEMLRAIFGAPEKPEPTNANISLDDKFRAAFSTFGTVKVQSEAAG